ncbi:MAG: dihydrodipicolinate synthase family protein [Pseudomonadota bacterium]
MSGTVVNAARMRGIHAATVTPLRADFSVDEAALEAHVAALAAVPGIEGFLINGHAGENFVLGVEEKARVIEVARAVIPGGRVLCAGVNAESSLAAAQEAAAAERAGADVVLVFPPNSFALAQHGSVVDLHHRHVLDACGLPILLYGAPVGAGRMAYPPETLLRLADDPRVIGIKEGSWEVAAYEATWRLFRGREDFAVLGSGDEHLLASYMIGSAGSQVSLAALVPQLIVDLFAAASAGEWQRARGLHDRVYPLANAIYGTHPASRATARLKAALALVGIIPDATVRPPQPPLSTAEIAVLKSAMETAGILV